ncbi:SDR family oxidoreductase [Patescibacteria group bacterium]|nr:SDR family oxidoreductase [Patescibacteria group bacterium]
MARGKSDEEAKNRVISDLKVADLWKEEYSDRLIVFSGKLEQTNFGLSDGYVVVLTSRTINQKYDLTIQRL